ncbi:type II toxin-antitoxin system CcdA family antitoxin [Paraburkholderia oxyphila]|uniref:type II toxin-antitoxin system CcdA family antitoxin n=1 Tax=Paraburkholderia oxyphila TaxID=614212 RepID=UPI000486DC12|nr:type II toxin-antitoxin system CcdA family antitoxin [Paraburkholderia oxyphila]
MAANVTGTKKATEVSLSEDLLSEARDLGVNVSQAADAGLAKAVSDKRAELWLKVNADAIACSNVYVEQNGLPLDEFRRY